MTGTPWAVLITTPNAEHLVARELKERHRVPFHFFQRAITCVHRGRIAERLRPAFPRYIFAKPEAVGLKHVDTRIVDAISNRSDGALWLVPHADIERLVEQCNGGNVFPAPSKDDPFQHGDEVIIIGHHPAAGHRAFYQHLLGNDHALVLFNWLGRMVPTDVDLRDIEKLQPRRERERSRKRRKNRRRRASRLH